MEKGYSEIEYVRSTSFDPFVFSSQGDPGDPTYELVEQRSLYFDRMMLIEQAAVAADSELMNYILKAVTEGLSYTYLKSRLEIPCSRDVHYDRYRKFFWLLDKSRN